jgi:16S rRNA (cytosine967-C5)-methyltransferase
MNNQGSIVAHDTFPDRLKLIEENCTRLGVTIAKTVLPADLGQSLADRVLLDAPCSNTGVMRRRVDLRWRIRPEEIERLRSTQLELVRQAARNLKPGGTLIYSTCSLEPEENEKVIEDFLGSEPGMQLEGQRELLPFADMTDGAYVARLTKRN